MVTWMENEHFMSVWIMRRFYKMGNFNASLHWLKSKYRGPSCQVRIAASHARSPRVTWPLRDAHGQHVRYVTCCSLAEILYNL